MEDTENKKLIQCIVGSSVRNIVKQANELNIQKEDIIQMFILGGQVYLVFYK